MSKITTTQRLAKIRTATLQLATERDLESISIYDVAKQASISTSTIYHHFPNIEALVCDLMDDIFRNFERVLNHALFGAEIREWSDINRLIENAFVTHYKAEPIVRNILFGEHSYASIRKADAVNDVALGELVEAVYRQYFHLPELPKSFNIFSVALQIADKVYSMDYRVRGEIGDEMAREAITATEAYLGTYLPKNLQRV